MNHIVIRHCTLRLARRGGWSWGPDPAKLAHGAVARITELLERKLPTLWQADDDIEIAAPVHLRIPVRLNELLGLYSARHENGGWSGAALEERMEKAIDAAFAPFVAASSSEGSNHEEENGLQSHAVAEVAQSAANDTSRGAWRQLLLSWHSRGMLAACLADFSPLALEAWHRLLLLASAEFPSMVTATVPEAFLEHVRELAQALHKPLSAIGGNAANTPSDRAMQLRLRLLVAVEAAARLDVAIDHPAMLNALDHTVPLDVKTSGESIDLVSATTAPAAASHRQWRGEFSVSSALPFLLLGPLSRIGYLDTLTTSLEAAGLLQDASLFAQALAYKALAPPERGWRRHTAEVIAATVFAGRADAADASDLGSFASRVSPHLSPLDVVLRESLISGHDPQQPLLIQRLDSAGQGGLLLVDAEGVFPIAWAADLAGLMPTLARFGATALLIPQATIASAPLSQLHNAGFNFITDAPPTRHESWRALRERPEHRFWTNDETTSESTLSRWAEALTPTTEETAVLWHALVSERPSIPLKFDLALDRSLTLAAAAALGAIAWTLWRDREPVVPYLALQRFHDLDARVSVDQDSVDVKLPLGRRYRDLYEHGLLTDVHGAPWLGGRVIRFSGG